MERVWQQPVSITDVAQNRAFTIGLTMEKIKLVIYLDVRVILCKDLYEQAHRPILTCSKTDIICPH